MLIIKKKTFKRNNTKRLFLISFSFSMGIMVLLTRNYLEEKEQVNKNTIHPNNFNRKYNL